MVKGDVSTDHRHFAASIGIFEYMIYTNISCSRSKPFQNCSGVSARAKQEFEFLGQVESYAGDDRWSNTMRQCQRQQHDHFWYD